MKLGQRLLVPVMLVSFIAVSLFGLAFYSYSENQIDSIYQGTIRTTLAGLEAQMEESGSLNDSIIERMDEKNISMARTAALLLATDDSYLTEAGASRLATLMSVGELHFTDGEGVITHGSDSAYWGRSVTEIPENQHLLDNIHNANFAEAQEPRVNSAGNWIQYFVVPRVDDEGLVVMGIENSIRSQLQQTFIDGINPDLATVGETGRVAVLRDGIIIAHKHEERVGEDISDQDWYAEIFDGDEDIEWLTISGEEFLAGHKEVHGYILLALLPKEEYSYTAHNMMIISIFMVLVSGTLIVFIVYYSLRRGILSPLAKVSESMGKVARGDFASSIIETPFEGEMETLRLDINQTIEHLRKRQDNILGNFPGVVFSLDKDYTCTVFAGTGVKELGLHAEDTLGRNAMEATVKYGDPNVVHLIEETFARGSARLNSAFKDRYLSFTGTLTYGDGGEITGMVGVCVDVTDLRQMQEKLMEATLVAERASAAKSEFLSRMSHEIRTPMNAIIGMTTIAKKSNDVAKTDYCLDKIQVASDQLLHLINDILDMSKIEANKFELSESEFDFEGMLQNVCSVIEVNATEKKQDFVIDFSEVFTRNVVTDELRLSQVLINLLNNAVKFTPEGGQVTLKIRHEAVDKSFGKFHFDVIDTGIGIPPEQMHRLFTSFEQADGSITRRYGGTGLGLAISKNIVQLLGGELEVNSTVGEGSCFSFTIDVGWGNEKGTPDLIHKLPMGDIRILVIDDSEDVCLYFENIIESYQFACDTAFSGPEGIDQVEKSLAAGKPYSLIFVDWMMPGMNGIETARHIKKIVPPDTIVIMISVADWSEIEREARSIGVDKFLAKPALPAVLFRSIVEWLNAAEREKAEIEEAEAISSFEGKVMLIAEDIDINREIILGMLEGTGIEIVCAEDGQQAVDKYTAEPDRFDIILMDIQMPGVDGYEATRLIRFSGIPGCKTIPIIAMTANAFSTDVERCLEAGMNDHIAKPVDMENLYQKLRVQFHEKPPREGQ